MSTRRLHLVLLLSLTALILGACATERAAEAPEPAVPALETEPWAIDRVEAPEDADSLSFAFADAVQKESGAPVVTKAQVTQEINDCGGDGCPTVMRDLFTQAPVIVTANVAAAGKGYLATGNARQGAKVIARASASGRSAEDALRDVGGQLGSNLRIMIINGEL